MLKFPLPFYVYNGIQYSSQICRHQRGAKPACEEKTASLMSFLGFLSNCKPVLRIRQGFFTYYGEFAFIWGM
jgi:hypothetical protein